MSLHQALALHIAKKYKALPEELVKPLISENLLSPFHVELPAKVLEQAKNFVSATFKMREKSKYADFFQSELKNLDLQDPGNKSILMSYDFHVDATGSLKLIEINTNASFLALGDLMYELQGIEKPIANFKIDELQINILEELRLNGKQTQTPRVAIIDEEPSRQRLFIEFLVYAELFKSWGWQADICNYRELSLEYDFVYNRFTDFYFKSTESATLKKWFNLKKLCFSPNPVEYFYLADKSRMLNWNKPGFLESMGLSAQEVAEIRSGLPSAQTLDIESSEKIWNDRKNLFFKPKQAFGAKQSYRGAKISRKVFDEIIPQDFIAQEFVPAPEIAFATPAGSQNFKYDLRFYAYKDRIQGVVARLYQGQVTNLKTPLGGFACVKFA